jgi:predicted nucleic-acid-binding Zn-ribbon protein
MKQELLGLTEIEEYTIKCYNCGTALAEVVLTETNEARQNRNLKIQTTKFKIVDCPKCGKHSFNTKHFHGSTVIGPLLDGYTLDEVDTEFDYDHGQQNIYSILKLRKNNG